jgi:hypothetical protein
MGNLTEEKRRRHQPAFARGRVMALVGNPTTSPTATESVTDVRDCTGGGIGISIGGRQVSSSATTAAAANSKPRSTIARHNIPATTAAAGSGGGGGGERCTMRK